MAPVFVCRILYRIYFKDMGWTLRQLTYPNRSKERVPRSRDEAQELLETAKRENTIELKRITLDARAYELVLAGDATVEAISSFVLTSCSLNTREVPVKLLKGFDASVPVWKPAPEATLSFAPNGVESRPTGNKHTDAGQIEKVLVGQKYPDNCLPSLSTLLSSPALN